MAIQHIILLKYKQGITPVDIEKVRASLRALPSQIPAIKSMKMGSKVKHPLDRDYDEGVIFVLEDEHALKKEYIAHKAHWEYQEYTAPYVADKLVFDIYSEE